MKAAVVIAALLGGLAGVELALDAAHGVPPGTWGVFGAIGGAVIVAVAKRLGGAGLQQPEPPDD